MYGRITGIQLPLGREIVSRDAVLVSKAIWPVKTGVNVQVNESPLRASLSGSSKTSRFVLWLTVLMLCSGSEINPGLPVNIICGSSVSAYASRLKYEFIEYAPRPVAVTAATAAATFPDAGPPIDIAIFLHMQRTRIKYTVV